MNKTKRELYEENKTLKKELEGYKEFWETKHINIKNILLSVNIVLLLISIFLMVEILR